MTTYMRGLKMNIPERPETGAEIEAGYFGRLWDYIRTLQVKQGKNIRVNQSFDGTTIEVIKDKPVTGSGGFGDDVVLVKAISYPSETGYIDVSYVNSDGTEVGEPFTVKTLPLEE